MKDEDGEIKDKKIRKELQDTISFVKSKFSEFYKRYKVTVPEIERREFGIGSWEKKIAMRHMSFDSEEKLRLYLIDEAPFYISYSTAYYEFPSNRPMETKNWLGADMVFDLDANLDGKKFPTEEQLNEVKDRTLRLIEEFLIPDFGYSKNDLSINFSGSKGYHIHLKDSRVINLSSDARKQIVDYIQGTMLDVKLMLKTSNNKVLGPLPSDKGWRGKIAAYVYNHPEFFYPRKSQDRRFLCDWRRTLRVGNWYFAVKSNKLDKVIEKASIRFSNDVDPQVTTDVHRLIRVPNTLHAGSGLCAVKFKVNALDKFDPLKHAVVFGGKSMKGKGVPDDVVNIKIIENIPKLILNDQTFAPISKGKTVKAPLYYAMYLVCHKAAEIMIR